MDISILYESKWVLAVNKPAGVVVEHARHYPSVEDWAVAYVGRQERKPYIGIVHRLDRPVSGVLLLAKRKAALKDLNAQFRERRVEKIYLATVENAPPKSSDTITHWLQKDQREKRAITFAEPQSDATACRLYYKFIGQNKEGFVLEVHPHSGKFHQIRAQLAAIGCPIIGDEKYGATLSYETETIALHAWKLRFNDPLTGTSTTVIAPPASIFTFE